MIHKHAECAMGPPRSKRQCRGLPEHGAHILISTYAVTVHDKAAQFRYAMHIACLHSNFQSCKTPCLHAGAKLHFNSPRSDPVTQMVPAGQSRESDSLSAHASWPTGTSSRSILAIIVLRHLESTRHCTLARAAICEGLGFDLCSQGFS